MNKYNTEGISALLRPMQSLYMYKVKYIPNVHKVG